MNAFVLPKAYNNLKEVRVEDVKSSFPSDLSQYHFRFQTRMGNLKVWVDTSKDSVAVPTIDGKIRMKLLLLPKGVKHKTIKIVPQAAAKAPEPVKVEPKDDYHDMNLLNPAGKKKSMPHSNSQNNIASPTIGMTHSQSHKPMSDNGYDDMIDTNYVGHNNRDDYINGMDFNLDTDEILGGNISTQSQNATDGSDYANLLGDFDENETAPEIKINNAAPPKPKAKQASVPGFDLGGEFGDLVGLDFNADISKKPQEEDKKEDPKIVSGIDHVKAVHKAQEDDRDGWDKAYQKYDSKVKMWKGMQQMNSIKVLLCTLHDVLWEGANWKRVGMHDLMDSNQVKK